MATAISDLAELQQAVTDASENPIVPSTSEPVDLAKHPSGIVPVLQNVVATVNLGCALDLKQIALHARNAEYNPKRFAAVIMRIREPKTTALIFASGKMVCTGAKSEDDSKLAARKYCRIIQKLGFGAEFKEFRVQNIVGSCDVKFPIRLEGIAYSHGYFATYEPELFPGLIYRMKQPKIVLLIFVSGKVVLTGAKRREEIYEAFEAIYPTLQQYRKQDTAASMQQALLPAPAVGGDVGAGPSSAAAAANGAGASGSGAGASGSGGGAMMPPPPMRAGGAPAAAGGLGPAPGMLPPPSPAHAPPLGGMPSLPPPTPHHVPPATPVYVPPATPSYVPPATPAYVPPTTSAYMPPPMPQAPRMPGQPAPK